MNLSEKGSSVLYAFEEGQPLLDRVSGAEPPFAPEDDPLDRSIIDSLRNLQEHGEPDLLAELIGLFFQEAPTRLAEIREASARGDAETLKRAAHTLKGSSGNMGAMKMAQICSQLQDVGIAGDLSRAPGLLGRLDEEFGRVRPALEAEKAGEQSLRILIAEDDAVSRTILQRSVEKFGHECLAAEDGEEAWDLFQSTPEVDVVISDWMMPGIEGPELCRRVRTTNNGCYTFFIFLTALGDKEHLLEGMRAGADDYLSKPFDREEPQVRIIAASRVTSLHRQLNEQKRELQKLNRELFAAARRDPLTGLGNRLQLREEFETLSAQAKRYGRGCCAMLCDVDSFKAYDDTYGHLAGDEMLERVANVISENLRAGDTAYRYGGEEFLILLPEQGLESASVAAERLRRGVEELAISHESRTLPGAVVTVSVGLAALTPGEKKTFEDLLKEADAALYGAKEGGKNGVELYSDRS